MDSVQLKFFHCKLILHLAACFCRFYIQFLVAEPAFACLSLVCNAEKVLPCLLPLRDGRGGGDATGLLRSKTPHRPHTGSIMSEKSRSFKFSPSDSSLTYRVSTIRIILYASFAARFSLVIINCVGQSEERTISFPTDFYFVFFCLL